MEIKQKLNQSKKQKRLLKIQQLCEKTKFSKTFIYDQIAQGNFPHQIRVGRSTFWLESEIDDYIDQLVSKRDAVQ